jgi:prepilin-type N-terminal cleavage/methylation domain-containing protein
MFKFLRRNKKGFTLVELIVVIAILAILAAIAVPAFMGITDEANTSVEIANAKTVATAINAYNALNPNSKITDKSNWSSVGSNLLPTGLPSDMSGILGRITISSDGVATVNTGEVTSGT